MLFNYYIEIDSRSNSPFDGKKNLVRDQPIIPIKGDFISLKIRYALDFFNIKKHTIKDRYLDDLLDLEVQHRTFDSDGTATLMLSDHFDHIEEITNEI